MRGKFTNLTGLKFGKLTVLKKTNKHYNTSVLWECICDCGGTKLVTSGNLTSGSTKSCGCIRGDTPSLVKNYKFDTNVGKLLANVFNKNNISGIKGVHWNNKRGKWVATIMFQKKNYFLGYYSCIIDAKNIRENAELNLYGEFLNWYNKINNSR